MNITLPFITTILIAASANATLLSYDGFDYPAGIFTSGSWSNLTGKYSIETGSMVFQTLEKSGNRLSGTSGLESALYPVSLADGATTWMSFIIRMDGAYSTIATMQDNLQLGFAMTHNSGHEEAGLRIQADASGNLFASADLNNALSAPYGISQGASYFMVLKYEDGGAGFSDDVLSLWINPTNTVVPGGEDFSAVVSNSTSTAINVFRVRVRNGSADFQFDEMRIGESYADVFPQTDAPEPPEPGGGGGTAMFGSWENMHPGGGGQIMGVFFDPLVPGKVFEVSDMEGVNLSHDYGDSWTPVGGTMDHGMQFVVVVEPGQTNRVYGGGLTGLNISDDGGRTWAFDDFFRVQPAPFDRGAVGDIAVDPNDPDLVYVVHGWQQKETILPKQQVGPIQETDGPRRIAISRDRGATWDMVNYEVTDGNKCVYSVEVEPVSRRVYLASEAGLYYSDTLGTNWTRLPDPAGTTGASLGAVLSPDGETLYATWRVAADDCRLFAARTDDITVSNVWKDVFYEEQFVDHKDNTYFGNYWQPHIDPRDTNDTHHVLINGLRAPRTGLWEGEFTWTGNSVTGAWTQVFWPSWPFNWERGWFEHAMMSQVKKYTPASWPRVLWATDGEGLFTLADGDDFLYDWDPRHCAYVGEIAGHETWRSRGFDSTYVYAADAKGSYIIQGQADNGCVQSFDGGLSWSRDNPHKYSATSNVDDVKILPTTPPTVVMSGLVHAYGGGRSQDACSLYGRQLINVSPDDPWVRFAGSENKSDVGLNGLDGMNYQTKTNYGPRVYSIDYDPNQPERVYLATVRGVYRSDDVPDLVTGGTSAPFELISSALGTPLVRKVYHDSVQTGTIYININSGIYRGENAHTASPSWTKVADHSNMTYWEKNLNVWEYEGTVYLVIGDGNDIKISTDRGATWNTTLGWNEILTLRPPSKEPQWNTSWGLTIGAVAGIGNHLFVSVESSSKQGYGLFHATLDGTTATWEDWTNDGIHDFYYARINRMELAETEGVDYLYISTKGNGTWRRSIELDTGASSYEEWLGMWPGITDGATDADPDEDGLNNLYEYALNGNPTNAADTGIPSVFQSLEDNGTNWFEYVHARRNDFDVRGLDYHLLISTNLVAGDWTNAYYEISGVGTNASAFDAVTNRLPMVGTPQQFIKLNVEQGW